MGTTPPVTRRSSSPVQATSSTPESAVQKTRSMTGDLDSGLPDTIPPNPKRKAPTTESPEAKRPRSSTAATALQQQLGSGSRAREGTPTVLVERNTPSPTSWAELQRNAAEVTDAAAAQALFAETGRAARLSPGHQLELLHGMAQGSGALQDGPAVELLEFLAQHVDQWFATEHRVAGMLSVGTALHGRIAATGDDGVRQRCRHALDVMMERVAARLKSPAQLDDLARQLLVAMQTPHDRAPAAHAIEAGLVLMIANHLPTAINEGRLGANRLSELLAAAAPSAPVPTTAPAQFRTVVDLAARANHERATSDAIDLLGHVLQRPAAPQTMAPLFEAAAKSLEREDIPRALVLSTVRWTAEASGDPALPADMLTRAVPAMLAASDIMNPEEHPRLLRNLAQTWHRHEPPDDKFINMMAIAGAILDTAAVTKDEPNSDRSGPSDAHPPADCDLALGALVDHVLDQAKAGDRTPLDTLEAVIRSDDFDIMPHWVKAAADRLGGAPRLDSAAVIQSELNDDPRQSRLTLVHDALETDDYETIEEALMTTVDPVEGVPAGLRIPVFAGMGAMFGGSTVTVAARDMAIEILGDCLAPASATENRSPSWRSDLCAFGVGLQEANGELFDDFTHIARTGLEENDAPSELIDEMEHVLDIARTVHEQRFMSAAMSGSSTLPPLEQLPDLRGRLPD